MTILYRCKNGVTDYGFSITRMPDGRYRAYIMEQPPYGDRDASLAATHRGQDGHGIYVASGPAWTPETAREYAALWAEASQRYLSSGRWEWDVSVSPRHLGIVRRVFPTYSFAHDDVRYTATCSSSPNSPRAASSSRAANGSVTLSSLTIVAAGFRCATFATLSKSPRATR